jgi:hypothetical protein
MTEKHNQNDGVTPAVTPFPGADEDAADPTIKVAAADARKAAVIARATAHARKPCAEARKYTSSE